jgi:hypothetical protein
VAAVPAKNAAERGCVSICRREGTETQGGRGIAWRLGRIRVRATAPRNADAQAAKRAGHASVREPA